MIGKERNWASPKKHLRCIWPSPLAKLRNVLLAQIPSNSITEGDGGYFGVTTKTEGRDRVTSDLIPFRPFLGGERVRISLQYIDLKGQF